MRILYYPLNNGVNEYSNRFRSILNKIGSVDGVSSKTLLSSVFKLKIKKIDFIFINWLESELVNGKGDFNFLRFTKCLAKLLLFKVISKKTIYVRHNIYPHAANKRNAKRVEYYTDLLESFCSLSIVHSPKAIKNKRVYIPHPLYISVKMPSETKSINKSYVFFGRITKYKKLEELIKAIPPDVRLTIVGSCDDIIYLEYLRSLTSDNITIKGEFISDHDAQLLISTSQGVIIAHSDDNMIVSGSFFYSLSTGVRIICVESEFLKWVEEKLGSNVIVCCQNIVELGQMLSVLEPRKKFDKNVLDILNKNFGDEAIVELIDKKVINANL